MKQVACDVLVAGSGAAGLACAFAAHEMGLQVILTEKADRIGGTTAWSGGELWVPASRWQRAAGIDDTAEAAIRYISAAADGRADVRRIRAYVEAADGAVAFFAERGAMAVEVMADAPDYFDNLPCAHAGGRSLRTVPFDGRALGRDFRTLQEPLPAARVMGGLSLSREDLGHLQSVTRSPGSALWIAGLVMAHGWQRLTGLHRGARTTMGNALVARFLAALRQREVPVWLSSPVQSLTQQGGIVTGARLGTPDGPVMVTVRRGVVLATGGFSHHKDMQRRHYPHARQGQVHLSLPPPEVAGDGIDLGSAVGGKIRGKAEEPAAWAAVSPMGAEAMPHFGDRAKPGFIAVTVNGRRFTNEAANYHDFCRALIAACEGAPRAEAFLIADHRALRRYGLGRVGPFPAPLTGHLRSGYLVRGRSLHDLAKRLDISPDSLAETVARYNADAKSGIDREFGKGGTTFDRASGDQAHYPNPCMAPLEHGPFYAIRIVPGNLSTFLGLDTDMDGAVLDAGGQAIPGIYAIGADAESVAGGSYPAAGITLGPAITFAWLTARAMAEKAARDTTTPLKGTSRSSARTA
jgi:succinate dehydrogenase/fumarate reductase flavoprotein subunit